MTGTAWTSPSAIRGNSAARGGLWGRAIRPHAQDVLRDLWRGAALPQQARHGCAKPPFQRPCIARRARDQVNLVQAAHVAPIRPDYGNGRKAVFLEQLCHLAQRCIRRNCHRVGRHDLARGQRASKLRRRFHLRGADQPGKIRRAKVRGLPIPLQDRR